jgi:hypothetical protein
MTHGAHHAYYTRKCRCQICKEWRAAQIKAAMIRAEERRSAKESNRLRAIDMARFAHICRYADCHYMTLKQAAKELAGFPQ